MAIKLRPKRAAVAKFNMASLTSSDGDFFFPDDVFPEVQSPFRGLPIAPQVKAQKIVEDYELTVREALATLGQTESGGLAALDQTHRLFRWARECLDFAESQPGVPKPVVGAALDIVRLVSSLEGSKFRGAGLYIHGLWYLFGLFDTAQSNSKARELFMKAAKAGYSRALYRIGSDFESRGDVTSAVTYFEHGVKRGDAACSYRLGMALMRGHLNRTEDRDTGIKLLEKASLIADPDCPQAAYMYGLMQLGELPNLPSPNPQKTAGIMALERSAWLGFGPALVRIGQAWQGGEKGYDSTIALRYFHWAARQAQYAKFRNGGAEDPANPYGGLAEAEISKWMLCGSEGVFSPNEEWAFRFASMATEYSNAIAEFAIGYFYEVGIYVGSDIDTALSWYRKSAEHGCADAQQRLKELEPEPTQPAQLGRRLTRKDHERTMSLRGRGSIRSSRKNAAATAAASSDASADSDKAKIDTSTLEEEATRATAPTAPPTAAKFSGESADTRPPISSSSSTSSANGFNFSPIEDLAVPSLPENAPVPPDSPTKPFLNDIRGQFRTPSPEKLELSVPKRNRRHKHSNSSVVGGEGLFPPPTIGDVRRVSTPVVGNTGMPDEPKTVQEFNGSINVMPARTPSPTVKSKAPTPPSKSPPAGQSTDSPLSSPKTRKGFASALRSLPKITGLRSSSSSKNLADSTAVKSATSSSPTSSTAPAAPIVAKTAPVIPELERMGTPDSRFDESSIDTASIASTTRSIARSDVSRIDIFDKNSAKLPPPPKRVQSPLIESKEDRPARSPSESGFSGSSSPRTPDEATFKSSGSYRSSPRPYMSPMSSSRSSVTSSENYFNNAHSSSTSLAASVHSKVAESDSEMELEPRSLVDLEPRSLTDPKAEPKKADSDIKQGPNIKKSKGAKTEGDLALTFEDMGVPAAKEEGKDCVIM